MGEGFPLWSLASLPWEGREPLRDWICLSVSLCFCVPDSALSPFLIFPEIRHSDCAEFWTLYPDISFLAAKEGLQPPYGVITRVQGAPPASWPPRASSRVDSSSQKSHIFQKNLRKFLSCLIWIFCETKNMQQTGTGTGHWINMLVPKIV